MYQNSCGEINTQENIHLALQLCCAKVLERANEQRRIRESKVRNRKHLKVLESKRKKSPQNKTAFGSVVALPF